MWSRYASLALRSAGVSGGTGEYVPLASTNGP